MRFINGFLPVGQIPRVTVLKLTSVFHLSGITLSPFGVDDEEASGNRSSERPKPVCFSADPSEFARARSAQLLRRLLQKHCFRQASNLVPVLHSRVPRRHRSATASCRRRSGRLDLRLGKVRPKTDISWACQLSSPRRLTQPMSTRRMRAPVPATVPAVRTGADGRTSRSARSAHWGRNSHTPRRTPA